MTGEGGGVYAGKSSRVILPPHWAMVLLGIGYGLHFSLMPVSWVPGAMRWLGVVPAVAGLLLIRSAQSLFLKKSTPVRPTQMPTALVTDGPFRYTRNPMYIGITLFLAGVAVGVGTWPLMVGPVFFPLLMRATFIPREEALMARLFGREYEDYRARVRRWI